MREFHPEDFKWLVREIEAALKSGDLSAALHILPLLKWQVEGLPNYIAKGNPPPVQVDDVVGKLTALTRAVREMESDAAAEAASKPGWDDDITIGSPADPFWFRVHTTYHHEQTFGDWFSAELERRGLSAGDVERQSGGRITRQHVDRLMRADRFKRGPNPGTIKIIAEASGINQDELLRRVKAATDSE